MKGDDERYKRREIGELLDSLPLSTQRSGIFIRCNSNELEEMNWKKAVARQ